MSEVLRRRPLMAFDFDGTLAPIVDRPGEAKMPEGVAVRLAALVARLPVAIVTGRSVADVLPRLGFDPTYCVGNHGAEIGLSSTSGFVRALEPLRVLIASQAESLAAVGVRIEDKGQSIAFHYRSSRCQERALMQIDQLLSPADQALRVFAGKKVVNVMAADAPDKAQAIRSLLSSCGAKTAFFAGDDINDEPVFVIAPPSWRLWRLTWPKC